jgi:hypothetical protein
MTNALSSMEYPHWLIIAGAFLLLLGCVGLALSQRSVEVDPGDMTSDQEPPRPEADLTPAEDADRTVKEKKRDRWADRERDITVTSNDRPTIYGKESR